MYQYVMRNSVKCFSEIYKYILSGFRMWFISVVRNVVPQVQCGMICMFFLKPYWYLYKVISFMKLIIWLYINFSVSF